MTTIHDHFTDKELELLKQVLNEQRKRANNNIKKVYDSERACNDQKAGVWYAQIAIIEDFYEGLEDAKKQPLDFLKDEEFVDIVSPPLYNKLNRARDIDRKQFLAQLYHTVMDLCY